MLQPLGKTVASEARLILNDIKGHTTQVMILITIIMLVIEFFGWQGPFHKILGPKLKRQMSWRELQLMAQLYTTLSFWLLFLILTASFLKLSKAQSKLQGLRLPSLPEFSPYALFGLFMIIVLSVICMRPSFYNFYPLYRPSSLFEWATFEAIYLPQFIAIEFFFRGPLLFFLNEKVDRMAIFIMTLPYAIIHIHKPFPEAIASIVAGIVLCHFALKTRSNQPNNKSTY